MTITEFLLARFAEREAVAKAANGPRWASGDGNVSEGGLYAYSPGSTSDRDCWAIAWFDLAETNPEQRISGANWKRRAHENSVHAALNDPAYVLADIAAKRRIVELSWHHFGEDDYAWGMEEAKRQILAIMALPYADHPDYDDSYRP